MRTKTAKLSTFAIAAALTFSSTMPIMAQSAPTPQRMMEMIQAQQRQLGALKAELQKAQTQAQAASAKAEQAREASSKRGSIPGLPEGITIGGVAELEITETKTFAQASSSDIALAKAELFVDTQLHDYLGTHVQFIYEDDGTETIGLDEANFTLGNTDEFPLYLMGGKWPMPFGGSFDTAMSTDPLTLNLGEVKEAAVLLGLAKDGAVLEGYIYNGDTQRDGEGNQIDQFGLSAGYGGELSGAEYNVGIGYINNIADADAVTDGLTSSARLANGYVAGLEVHGDVTFKGITLRGAYMMALDDFASGNLAFNGQGAEPSAWVSEASYTVDIMGKETTFAGTVQGTSEALALSLPELRVGGAITVGVVEHFAITGEYLHDEDYGTSDGGTGSDGHTATLKLTAEF